MKYKISVDPQYQLTDEDLHYLSGNGMQFTNGQIQFQINEKYQLDRAKAAIRKIPNDSFYNSLKDDLCEDVKPRPVIRAKSKS